MDASFLSFKLLPQTEVSRPVVRRIPGMTGGLFRRVGDRLEIACAPVRIWHTRFEREGFTGLHDDHRKGACPPKFDTRRYQDTRSAASAGFCIAVTPVSPV